MKRLLMACLAPAVILFLSAQAQNQYVGAGVCASCHNTEAWGKMVDHWQQSGHSNAVRTLERASENAPRKFQDFALWVVKMGRGDRYGLPSPAAESQYCLPCHGTAFGYPPQLVASSFDPKAGVQCEACHGPGSAHVEMERIKGSGKPIPADEVASAFKTAKLAEFKRFEDERAVKARCVSCHDGMCGDFDFPKMWPLIKHTAPK